METAKPDSWQREPMPDSVSELDYEATFSKAEFELIARGLIPESMDDKWFVYMEGDRLNVHRSWTGHCIYEVDFEMAGDAHAVLRARVNRDPDQYQATDDTYDAMLLVFVIRRLMLGEDVPCPLPG